MKESTYQSVGKSLSSPTLWVILVVATILCAFAGPFGTYSVLGLPLRLIYWGLIIVATGMLGGLGIIMIDVWGVKTWYGRLGLCLGFGVIASGLVVFISLALLGPIGAMPPIMMLVLYSQPTATIVFALIYLLLHRQNRPDILLTQDNRPALLSRLTLGQEAATVECITAQDHYVNVQTDAGSELCLIRFRDAIAETYPVEGIQIHRSHWIAWHALVRVETHNGRVHAFLSNGTTVPVSRSNVKALRTYLAQRR